jgi:hypothetical protein
MNEDYEEKWVVVRDTTGGTEFIIDFEGSQALPACPSGRCKHSPVIWKFNLHSKEHRLLGYKNKVRTSEETH